MKTILEFVIPTPYFQVRLHMEDEIEFVNEYTFRNMQLAVKEKRLAPFYFANTKNGWERVRKDGICAGSPFSSQYKSRDEYDSAMSITSELALRLLTGDKPKNSGYCYYKANDMCGCM
jgi:hypothetical protein